MLINELDVMEYAATMEDLLLSDAFDDADVMTEAEADEFLDWLYDDTDITDISKSDLWKLCNSNIDANFSSLMLTVFDNCDNIVFQGIAMDYPYDWYDCKIVDYSTYNIGNTVCTDVWAEFTTWK